MPDSATVSGLPGALLFTDRVPLAEPAAVGANDTLTAQEAPAASDVPQLLVSLNGPVTPTEAIETAAEPGFDTVTVLALAAPTAVLPKDTLDGDAVSGEPAGPVEPPPGKTSNSDSWAADQPVLPVKL
ncbi:MAG TPA: hypothetical protein VHT26_16005, partial [Trebonia sp.]|nr:hypothetical protein [Trebonia sp.]